MESQRTSRSPQVSSKWDIGCVLVVKASLEVIDAGLELQSLQSQFYPKFLIDHRTAVYKTFWSAGMRGYVDEDIDLEN